MTPLPGSGDHSADSPTVRALSPPQAVPVFNCVVYVSRESATGIVVARAANLPEVQATGVSEREALQRVVTGFKEAAARYVAAGQTPPLVTPPALAAGETQRLIAVHL